MRGSVRGFNAHQFDLALRRDFRLLSSVRLQMRFEMFNLFNTANFADPSGGLVQPDVNTGRPTAFFGQSISTVGNQLGGLLGFGVPRQIQLSARFNF